MTGSGNVGGSSAPARRAGFEGRFDELGWYLIGRIFRLRRTLGRDAPSLVDLGMGRGRDAIYFARRGFRVLGVDRDPVGIERARRRAARLKTRLRTRLADLRTVVFAETFDVVYSNCALNGLPPTTRRRQFARFRADTASGGIHAVNVFVAGRPAREPGDTDPNDRPFRPGELRMYYRGWEILESRAVIFGCSSTGVPHRHALELIVARRPS